jgi:hypothetical protein
LILNLRTFNARSRSAALELWSFAALDEIGRKDMATEAQCPFCNGVHYSSYNAERCRARHEAREQLRPKAKGCSASSHWGVSAGGVLRQAEEDRTQNQSANLRASAS